MKRTMEKMGKGKSIRVEKTVPPPAPPPPESEGPLMVELRAEVRGEVTIRLRVFDPVYTPKKLAKLLNRGNAMWDVGNGARYHHIEDGGKVVAEIEFADEDWHWENYQAD